MKKIVLLLLFGMMIVTGCSVVNIESLTYDEVVTKSISDTSPKANKSVEGYKFYLPRRFKVHSYTDTNLVLIKEGTKYYVYVDLVSYYNKKNNLYQLDSITDEIIYKKNIENNGYVLITTVGEKVYLQVLYNYAKIEKITNIREVKEDLYNSLALLKSISYNDIIVSKIVGNITKEENVEEYNVLGPKNASSSNFLDYVKDYEDVDNELPDDDTLDIE